MKFPAVFLGLLWENLRLGPAADDDVLFCPSFSRPRFTRAKTVVTVYEATLALYPQYFPRNHFFARPEIYVPIYRWSAQNATLVLTTTQAAKNDVMKAYGVPEERIRMAPLAPAPGREHVILAYMSVRLTSSRANSSNSKSKASTFTTHVRNPTRGFRSSCICSPSRR